MLTRWVIPLAVMTVGSIVLYVYLQDIVSYPVADSLFVSAQLFFFYGLIRTTNATAVFDGFSYSWRRMFFRRGLEDTPGTFLEQKQIKDDLRSYKNESGNPGPAYLLVSIIMFLVSYNLMN
jgi:hypothetical protein